jgi:signal transduction histidine kinase
MDRSALDAAPIPTVVLRDTRVAYANDALLSLLKTTREAFLGRPYTDFVAPDELERVADRQARRLRGEHSPSVYVTTLLWGTERRSVRVHAAASGGDIVVQFIDVTGEAVRSTRLSAMAQLGALVQRELREDDVRRTVLEALPGLELEGIVFRPDGDELRVEDARLEPGRAARFELAFGKSMVGSRQPWIPALRQAWKDGAVFMDEWLAEARRLAPGELPSVDAADAARRSAAAVRVDVGGRPDALLVAVGQWLRAEDLPAFWLFGSQVSAALDAARSIQVLSRRNAELAALNAELSLLNEVGRSVAGSLDLDRILGEGARAVRQLLSTTHCHVLLVDAVHRELRCGASTAGEAPGLLDGAASLDAPLLAAAAVRERRPFAVHDLAGSAFRDVAEEAAHGAWAVLAAPVLFRDQPMGVLVVCEHGGPRRFTAAEIERAMAVANQLAVAIDNARLFDETRRRAEELELLQDQLVHQERLAALGELAAVVAHEVRNPLGAIFNSLGTLRRMVRPRGDAKMLFDIVGEEADHLNRIVGQLLDFARPAPATMRAEPLDRVLDEAVAAALAEAHGRIALVRDVPDGLPLIPMDAGLIRQALLNVALNAVQAMPKGGTLSVHARLSGEAAVVELADTGPGIPEEVRHRIFEPFFTTKATGTGLGLAVVKRILEDHRGRVEVRGRDSGGTVFALHLPLTAPAGKQRRAIPSAGG